MPNPNIHAPVPVISPGHVPGSLPCAQGHDWQPTTIIIGYYQCSRCTALAACRACVSTVRGSAIAGLCRAHHQRLGVPLAQQHHHQEEVLG